MPRNKQTEIPGTDALPVKGFNVIKQEVWTQIVYVEAYTKGEALDKAVTGDYTVHVDSSYERDLRPDTWKVKEVPDVG